MTGIESSHSQTEQPRLDLSYNGHKDYMKLAAAPKISSVGIQVIDKDNVYNPVEKYIIDAMYGTVI